MTANWIKQTATALLLSFGFMQLPVQAAMLPTEAVVESSQTATVQQRVELTQFLARADVQVQLARMGVDPAEASGRVAALSDAEVLSLHGKMQELPAGGNGVVGAIIFIFIVLLITDILGLTKIFPFTRSVR